MLSAADAFHLSGSSDIFVLIDDVGREHTISS